MCSSALQGGKEGGRVRVCGLSSAIIDNEQRAGFSVLIFSLSVHRCCEKQRKQAKVPKIVDGCHHTCTAPRPS